MSGQWRNAERRSSRGDPHREARSDAAVKVIRAPTTELDDLRAATRPAYAQIG